MLYALNDPLASFVFIYCIIVWKCMLKCVLRVRIKIYIYKAHVRYTAFATLQIELYHVVHYNSKWSTKFHMDCMLEIFVISLLRRLMIILLIF